MGLDALVQVNEAYKQIGVQLHLSHCKRKQHLSIIYKSMVLGLYFNLVFRKLDKTLQ